MRAQITIIAILFFPFFVKGQQSIDGCYCLSYMGESNKEVEAVCITFHSNNSFSYEYSFFEYAYGNGNYCIKEDSLFLQFDSFQKQANKLIILDSSLNKEDSINIELNFVTEQIERGNIIGVLLKPYTIDNDEKHFIEGNWITTNDSLKKFRIKKQYNDTYLEVRALGITPTMFKINGVRDIKGTCYLYDGYNGKINGEIYRYKILKKKYRKLLMQVYDYEGNKTVLIFRKKQ
ncbi:MAG: hypothetical protein IPH45_08165 [Bacteroidales bacterium]|nr:hypothetical protein [Bacteroidales bacterium]